MQIIDSFESQLRSIFKPPDALKVWEWAEREIMLSEKQTEMPGKFSTLLTPYMREPLESFADKNVSDIVLCFGSQTGKTTVVMIGVAWRVDHDPKPLVWVMPSESLARSFSENRWQQIVNDSPTMARHKPHDTDKFKILEQQFDRCTLTFVGSNSPANLASRPAGILIMDEVDKFAQASDKEASALMLAENRTKAFANPLRVKTSTPTTEFGEIWTEFNKGDQRYYHVPCPHCKDMIRLEWKQVRWDQEAKVDGVWQMEKVRSSTHYECPSCAGKITDAHKTSMLRGGKWIASNPNAEAGRRSYHLNSLYAPWRSCSFGQLAVQFLQAKATINGLQDFMNSALAEPWRAQEEVEATVTKEGEYIKSDVWPAEHVRFMTVDVQKDHFWSVIRSWSVSVPQGSRLVWEGKLGNWDDVRKLQTDYRVEDNYVLVDFGFSPSPGEVQGMCAKYGWMATKGEDRKSYHIERNGKMRTSIYARPRVGDAGIGMRHDGAKLYRWTAFSAPSAKDILHALKTGAHGQWSIALDTSKDYREQINAESKVPRVNPRTGATVWEWKQVKRHNHLFDCEVLQVLAAVMTGLLRVSAEDQLSIDDSDGSEASSS